jgi:hypothetical protein
MIYIYKTNTQITTVFVLRVVRPNMSISYDGAVASVSLARFGKTMDARMGGIHELIDRPIPA